MFTFKKEERLSSRKEIQDLYETGKSFNSKCFRVFWKSSKHSETFPAQVLISVSKKNFKRAVDRNRIKRLIREAYRKNKHLLYESLNARNKKIIFALSYITKEELTFTEIENKIIVTLQHLEQAFEKNN